MSPLAPLPRAERQTTAWCCSGTLSAPTVPPQPLQYVRPVPVTGVPPFICGPKIRILSLNSENGDKIGLSWKLLVLPVGQKALWLTPSGVYKNTANFEVGLA